MRQVSLQRQTSETEVVIDLNIDSDKKGLITTGLGFLDHMLEQLSFHGGFYLNLQAEGDLEVDCHHLVEDVGLLLGKCFKEALGDRLGINRYGMAYIPMDESLIRCVIDLCNRPVLIYKAGYKRDSIGGLALENVREFLKSFVNESGMTLHVEVLYGDNDHHKVEGIFKALGQSLKGAIGLGQRTLLSTKGVL